MLVTIFYHVDEFCKIFEATLNENAITKQKQRAATIPILSFSEIMTICIFYHYSGYKNFKVYSLSIEGKKMLLQVKSACL